MIPAARRRLDPAEDTGAALVLALILITVVALVVSAMLSFSNTSVRVTIAVRSQAGAVYGADGAAQAAITALRRSPFNNDTSSPTYPKCFGAGATDDTLALNNFYPGTTGSAASSAVVRCTPDPNTGAAGGLVQITTANKPGNAILTLGTNPAEDGLNVKPLSNSIPFIVHGGVVSDSNIRVSNGTLQSNTSVFAHTGCTGTIVSVPAANCAAGTVADPPYSSEAGGVVPTYRAVPTATAANCPVVGGGRLVTFQPGYYDDAQALNALMNGPASNPCQGSVWWFTPGTYYFDFHNSSNPLLPSGGDVWTIGDGQLIAGTPVNSAGTVISKPTVPATVPGSCQNPIKDDAAVGVQFIFGGDSQLQLSKSADAEICASYHTDRPPIAIFGLKAGAETMSPLDVTKLSSVTSDANFGATASVANLVDSDTLSASWTKAGSSNQTAGFTANGYAPASAVPPSSVLNSATLTVTYQNTGNVTANTRTVTLTPRSADGTAGTPITVPLPSNSTKTVQTATVDLYGSGTSALAGAVHSLGYSGASAAYSIQTKQAGIETVDTIQLNLKYTPPAFRSEDVAIPGGNCLTSTYTGTTGGGCAVLTTSVGPNYKGRFYVQGTTYVPRAVVDLTLNNITAQVLRFGVISRSLWVKETGSITYSGPVIEIPDNSPGFGPGGTVVYLDVYLCEAAASCSVDASKLRLRAKVLIYDPTTVPNPPARQITIQSWSVQR